MKGQVAPLDPTAETKEEFESRYREGFPRAVFGKNTLAVRCTCDDGGGPTHWGAIPNTPEAIGEHESHEEILADIREMGGL